MTGNELHEPIHKKPTIPCKPCKGTGIMKWKADSYGLRGYQVHERACSWCNGTGRIKVHMI